MHELILLRHAKAVPAGIDAVDFERALTDRGVAAARRAGRALRADGARIGRVLYSPARRTSETAAIVARELGLGAELLQAVPELYAATPAAIRGAIAAHHGGAGTLLLVGHNPGLSQLGGELEHGFSSEHLPTAGYWRLPLDAPAWRALTESARRS
jgi:phosphohistidine phosphatase SixA